MVLACARVWLVVASQWLTFWLILTLMLFVERYLARVVLSTVPLYYELKLGLLAWLLGWDGADAVYRRCGPASARASAPVQRA
jgi:hypothetical protein